MKYFAEGERPPFTIGPTDLVFKVFCRPTFKLNDLNRCLCEHCERVRQRQGPPEGHDSDQP